MSYLDRLKSLNTRQEPTDRTDKSTYVGFVSSRSVLIEPVSSELAEARAHKGRVVDWLNANPASSLPESCTLCAGPETWGNTLIPFGVGPHAWLHSDCWPTWRYGRIKEAKAALVVADRSVQRTVE